MAGRRSPKSVIVAIVLVLASAGCTTMVRSSTAPNHGPGNGFSAGARGPALSDDGRYVTFESFASNLVPGDTNGDSDTFRHDNVTGETIRVSLKNDESQIAGTSAPYAISGDGTHVLFVTSASLEPADTNQNFDAYVRDIPAGTTERVSIRPDGSPISPDSGPFPGIRSAWLNDDGRRALVLDLESGTAGLAFFRNLDTDTTTVLAGNADRAVLSGDGSWMAYTALCAGRSLLRSPGHARSRPTGRAAKRSSRTATSRSVTSPPTAATSSAFRSGSDTQTCSGPKGVVRWDRVTKQMTKVPVARDDLIPSTGESANLTISNDGRFVAFIDTRTIAQVVDMVTGRTIVVDTDSLGRPRPVGDSTSNLSLSGDGRYVAFQATGARTPEDTNGLPDVFTRYAIQPTITAVSPSTVARGAHVTLQVGGSEYLPGMTAFFSDGSGITVDGVTVVSPERVDVSISVAPDAPTGLGRPRGAQHRRLRREPGLVPRLRHRHLSAAPFWRQTNRIVRLF